MTKRWNNLDEGAKKWVVAAAAFVSNSAAFAAGVFNANFGVWFVMLVINLVSLGFIYYLALKGVDSDEETQIKRR